MKQDLKVFAGNGNPKLARAICEYLRVPMGQWNLTRFADGEVYCQVLENVEVPLENRVGPHIVLDKSTHEDLLTIFGLLNGLTEPLKRLVEISCREIAPYPNYRIDKSVPDRILELGHNSISIVMLL